MAGCPATCGDIEIVSNPQANCEISQRKTNIQRIAFFPCNTELPSPIQGSIKPLFDDGTIAWSSPLRNVTVNDPTTQDIALDDCSPLLRLVTGREITAEDTYSVNYTTGSPATMREYWDYNFWLDKQNKPFQLRAMLIYCNGDVKIPQDADGNYLQVTVYPYLNYERPSQQGGPFLEFKRLSFLFNGDPLALNVIPAFNTVEEDITF